MLNRRTLRIKIMQNLFAYEQCREANHLLALDSIEDRFKPDLNSMEVQDKTELNRQKKLALQLFNNVYKGKKEDKGEEAVDQAAHQAMELYLKQSKRDLGYLGKNMVVGIEQLNHLYHSILALIVAFAEVSKDERKISHSHFYSLPIIKAIQQHEELRKNLLKEHAGWDHRMDKVRTWFRDVVRNDTTYQNFVSARQVDAEEQKAIIKHLVRKLIFGPTMINDFFEEEDINWAEDREVLKSLVDKTIKSYDADSGQIQLQKLSLDWEDDRVFMQRLFDAAANIDVKYKQLIAKNTKNWEVDRLPLTDRVILEMAISELMLFPGIPIKVSINEYIELAKRYSTPKSRQFVNGILDVMAKELVEKGDIKKSGKGLIDNK